MCRNSDIIENVLVEIEKGIRVGINADILAQKYTPSESYLRKLFKFAFKQTISSYIRSRKLTASLKDLLESNANIADIALIYNFDYEQSYIRAFKQKFGLTPGNYRKLAKIKKASMPFYKDKLIETKKCSNYLRKAELDYVRCPYCRAEGFVFNDMQQ